MHNSSTPASGRTHRFYREYIADFLPEHLTDMHAHLDVSDLHKQGQPTSDQDPPEVIPQYQRIFPEKKLKPLLSAASSEVYNAEFVNAHISRLAKTRNLPALLFPNPQWDEESLDVQLTHGGFYGVNVIPEMAPHYLPSDEVRIFDLLPPHQCEVLNSRNMIALIVLPRSRGVTDPVNLAQLSSIAQQWPNVTPIITSTAPVSDATDLDNALSIIQECEQIRFDLTMNCGEWFWEKLLSAADPRRILFGTNLHLSSSSDVVSPAVETQTEELYQRIDTFRKAAQNIPLSDTDIFNVFTKNGATLLEQVSEYVPHQQLQMVVPEEGIDADLPPELPRGYVLRTFREGDEESYTRLMQSAGFKEWGTHYLESAKRKAVPGGIFFILYEPEQQLAATACGLHNPDNKHPFGAEIGWVATDPRHRGQKLAYIASIAVIRRLQQAGYQRIYLKTDDYRLPALKTFLKLGLVPYLEEAGMAERWRRVCRKLNLDYDSLRTATSK